MPGITRRTILVERCDRGKGGGLVAGRELRVAEESPGALMPDDLIGNPNDDTALWIVEG